MSQVLPDIYWDPYDVDVDVHAQEIWKRMRDECPVYYNDKLDFYAVTRFDDVLRATTDTETFSSSHTTTLEMMGPEPVDVPMMIWLDPPEHTRLRQLVNRAFTPRAIERLEERVERICARLLDPFVGTKGFDYVDDFGALLPPTVILEMLGFPEGREQEWRHVIDHMFHEMGATGADAVTGDGALPSSVMRTAEDAQSVVTESELGTTVFGTLPVLIEERRREPTDDILSALVHARIDEDGQERQITQSELYAFVQMLAIAGTETVARFLSWAAVLLARHPEQRQLLVDDPSLIPNAVEELLRYEAPSPVNARWVTRDVELHGTTIPAGSKLIMLNGAANRDERVFENPDRLDVRRKFAKHLSLGYGAHYCVGAALARLEGRIALRETLARFPMWEVDEDHLEWVHTSTVRGYARVPMILP
ncbi:MAG TPA: cytochrome P450 [Acidimicrobiia bacterium]|jgi:cytochrome P450